MTRLEDLEEWCAIRAIQPLMKSGLEAALVSPQSANISRLYFISLESLKLDLDQFLLLEKHQTSSSDGLTKDIKTHLNKVLTALETLVGELFIFQESPVSQAQDDPSTSQLLAMLRNYTNLQRLVRSNPSSGFRIKHQESNKDDWECVSRAIIETSKFVESIAQRPDPLIVETRAKPTQSKVDDRIHKFAGLILTDIQNKLSQCERQATHDTLFTIYGLETRVSDISALHLDLLFRSCATPHDKKWQKATCLYDLSLTSRDDVKENLIRPLNNLCETVQKYLESSTLESSKHLHLTLDNQRVVRCDFPQGNVDLRATEYCRTLGDLLEKNYLRPLSLYSNGLTVWEKRTMALQLSHLFLHLHDCEWAANRWTTSDVQFPFSNQQLKILESPPYIKCNNHDGHGNQGNESKFLALAKLLVEIELGEEIKELECNVFQQPSLSATLRGIISRDRMSSHGHYTEAVEQCLKLSEDFEEPQSMRDHIFERIVENLQKDLDMMKPPKEDKRRVSNNVVEVAPMQKASSMMHMEKELTDSRYISGHRDPSMVPHLQRKASKFPVVSADAKTRVPRAGSALQSFPKKRRRDRSSTRLTDSSSTVGDSPPANDKYSGVSTKKQKPGVNVKKAKVKSIGRRHIKLGPAITPTIQLFEDFDDHTQDGHKKTSAEEFAKLYTEFRRKTTHQITLSTKIKVCVIDTGLDEKHPAIQAANASKAIRERQSFMKQPNDTNDYHGHGTHMVELILKSSSNVEVYIAKIADKPHVPNDDIGIIANAINHAVQEWKVDIITMSFGFRERNDNVEDAINEATHCGTLLFAAASNQGSNGPRQWPARDEQVICISASDGKGKDGGISPAALNHDDNFMTLGLSVPLFWKRKAVYRSGTSYATPIAVGFAINVLEICSSTDTAKMLRKGGNMRRIFRLFSTMDNGYKYIAPWILRDKCRDIDHLREMIDSELR